MAATGGQERAASWSALGTTIVLKLERPGGIAQARAAVEAELEIIDRVCSRFRADSEITALNARAGRRAPVGPELARAIELALRAAELTDGDVDPTIGGALELAGYDRDFSLLDPPAGRSAAPRPLVSVRVRSGWREVALDAGRRVVMVPAGITLDLGATAKAWAADRAARAAALAAGCGALVGVGGDFSCDGEAPAGGWRIHVTDDHRSSPGAPGQTIAIRSGGLATSSTTVRRWNKDGRDMHHIIDPASGEPAPSRWRTVSVAAGDCMDANIAATAAIIRSAAAPAWLSTLGLPARLVDVDGGARTVGGWPEEAPAHAERAA